MLYSIFGGEIKQSVCYRRVKNHRIDVGVSAVSEKHRAGLRAQNGHVAGAIIFLVTPGALMLANQILVILINRATGDDANLLVVSHDQAVKIQTGNVLSYEWRIGN